jgi:hypothetical protein
MTVTFRHGRKPPHPESTHPRVKLAPALNKATLPAPPATVDWYSQITDWPMLANDRAGDCVEAEQGHHEQVFTTCGAGKPATFTDADAVAVYSAITGYDPADPSTDQGTVIQDAMSYWRKVGFAGRKIAAFAEVNVKDEVELKTALALFGPLSGGMTFPAVAMDQFNEGKSWDVVRNDGGNDGGHCVCIVGYDATYVYCITWGAVQKMTWAFFREYFEELWAPLSSEWVNAQTGLDPEGVDLSVVGEQFSRLTGQNNPFPGPAPQPQPVPVPTPAPVPPGPAPVPVGPADQSLAATAREWLRHFHTGSNGVMAKELRAWLAAKNLL